MPPQAGNIDGVAGLKHHLASRFECFAKAWIPVQIGIPNVHEADGNAAGSAKHRAKVEVRDLFRWKQHELPPTGDNAREVPVNVIVGRNLSTIADPHRWRNRVSNQRRRVVDFKVGQRLTDGESLDRQSKRLIRRVAALQLGQHLGEGDLRSFEIESPQVASVEKATTRLRRCSDGVNRVCVIESREVIANSGGRLAGPTDGGPVSNQTSNTSGLARPDNVPAKHLNTDVFPLGDLAHLSGFAEERSLYLYTRKTRFKTLKRHVGALACLMLLASIGGCGPERAQPQTTWAVNIGAEYLGADGTRYISATSVSGGRTGTLESVKGTQDPALYREFRQGDFHVSQPMDNGTYDVTFHFAEPEEIGPGERVFDVIAEGKRVAEDLDVMVYRDGQIRSALTVTVLDVEVEDGSLTIEFDASVGEPILSALAARPKVPRHSQWKLVWSDEFDVPGAPSTDNWTLEEWPPRVVNSEDQAYTLRPKNVRVEDGLLVIEAHRERWNEAEYTSGRMHSSGKQDFLYGRFEARAKVPRGVGTWAAIWMLPSDPFTYATMCNDVAQWQGNEDCDAWPNSGEIDILEHVGYQMGHVHGTVHNRAYYFINWQQRKGRVLVDDVADEFHVYAMEWSPHRIDVFIDETPYFSYVNEGKGWETWPYDYPFHWILNLAIGGDWGRAGGPIDNEIFPQRMLVDYVRVYQRPAP